MYGARARHYTQFVGFVPQHITPGTDVGLPFIGSGSTDAAATANPATTTVNSDASADKGIFESIMEPVRNATGLSNGVILTIVGGIAAYLLLKPAKRDPRLQPIIGEAREWKTRRGPADVSVSLGEFGPRPGRDPKDKPKERVRRRWPARKFATADVSIHSPYRTRSGEVLETR